MTNDFFNDLGSSISRAAQTTYDKTSSFFNVQKINVKIAAEKGKLEKLYAVLGEAYYKKLAEGCCPVDEEIAGPVEEAAERLARIDSLKAELAKAKGMRICESCGNMAAAEDAFCAKCGAKLPEAAEEEPAAEDPCECAEEACESAEESCECAEEPCECAEEPCECAEEACGCAGAAEACEEAAGEAAQSVKAAAEELPESEDD